MLKPTLRKIKSLFYNCYCPICIGFWKEWNEMGFDFNILKKVKIIGGGKRKHVCPNCSSSDRLRLIYTYLEHFTRYTSGENEIKVLHIAPERLLKEIFEENLKTEYYPCDKFNYGGDILEADITDLSFENNFFDLIICNHVLEHVIDDIKAMNEFYRVMKKGGNAILQIPYSNTIKESIEDPQFTTKKEREINFGQEDHVRIYSRKNYIDKLKSVGFTVNQINPYTIKWPVSPKKLGLNKNECLFIVKK